MWTGLAVAAGLLLGRWVPGIADVLGAITLPIATALIWRDPRGSSTCVTPPMTVNPMKCEMFSVASVEM